MAERNLHQQSFVLDTAVKTEGMAVGDCQLITLLTTGSFLNTHGLSHLETPLTWPISFTLPHCDSGECKESCASLHLHFQELCGNSLKATSLYETLTNDAGEHSLRYSLSTYYVLVTRGIKQTWSLLSCNL